MKKLRTLGLKQKMMAVSLLAVGLMFTIITITFFQTTASLRQKSEESLDYMAEEVDINLENLLRSLQTNSELQADNPLLIGYLQDAYGQDWRMEKLRTIKNIRENIFDTVNRTEATVRISAIYTLKTGELFNFMDANKMDGQTIGHVLGQLEKNPARGAGFFKYRYHWQPLQSNFLAEPTGSVRQDNVVIGTRWIHDTAAFTYSVEFVHVFALPERNIYDCYALQVEQFGGQAYILNGNGGLISSSNEEVVASKTVDEDFVRAILSAEKDSLELSLDGTDYFAKVGTNMVGDDADNPDNTWYTVLLIPRSYATQDMYNLYVVFALVLVICVALSGALLVYLYRQFMNPISNLSAAMKKVDKGNFGAYVEEESGVDNEATKMIVRYNRMLRSVNRTMEEQVALEQSKKELDMQVLTNQINPHFLYNTLETIVWKAGQAGHPDIGKIAASLGKLYRLSISGGELFVPLMQELEHVESYIEIQKSRYAGRFSYELCFKDKELGKLRVPKIILQPVVENIFLYAITESEETVAIRITAKKQGGELVIRVLDNGPGMNRDRLEQVREQIRTGKRQEEKSSTIKRRSTGIGLHNIKARLELYMGAENALSIRSKQGLGTCVCIRVPLMGSEGLQAE